MRLEPRRILMLSFVYERFEGSRPWIVEEEFMYEVKNNASSVNSSKIMIQFGHKPRELCQEFLSLKSVRKPKPVLSKPDTSFHLARVEMAGVKTGVGLNIFYNFTFFVYL